MFAPSSCQQILTTACLCFGVGLLLLSGSAKMTACMPGRQPCTALGSRRVAESVLVNSALAFVTQLVPVAAGVQRVMHMALDVFLRVRLPWRGFYLHADVRAEPHVNGASPCPFTSGHIRSFISDSMHRTSGGCRLQSLLSCAHVDRCACQGWKEDGHPWQVQTWNTSYT